MNDNFFVFAVIWFFLLALTAVVAALRDHDVLTFTTLALMFPLPALIAACLVKPRAGMA